MRCKSSGSLRLCDITMVVAWPAVRLAVSQVGVTKVTPFHAFHPFSPLFNTSGRYCRPRTGITRESQEDPLENDVIRDMTKQVGLETQPPLMTSL